MGITGVVGGVLWRSVSQSVGFSVLHFQWGVLFWER